MMAVQIVRMEIREVAQMKVQIVEVRAVQVVVADAEVIEEH
jgi:hypothetical protein